MEDGFGSRSGRGIRYINRGNSGGKDGGKDMIHSSQVKSSQVGLNCS